MEAQQLTDSVPRRLTELERWRNVTEAEDRTRGPVATERQVNELTKRFDALIKAIWSVALLIATVGGTILASHL